MAGRLEPGGNYEGPSVFKERQVVFFKKQDVGCLELQRGQEIQVKNDIKNVGKKIVDICEKKNTNNGMRGGKIIKYIEGSQEKEKASGIESYRKY